MPEVMRACSSSGRRPSQHLPPSTAPALCCSKQHLSCHGQLLRQPQHLPNPARLQAVARPKLLLPCNKLLPCQAVWAVSRHCLELLRKASDGGGNPGWMPCFCACPAPPPPSGPPPAPGPSAAQGTISGLPGLPADNCPNSWGSHEEPSQVPLQFTSSACCAATAHTQRGPNAGLC